MRGSRAAPSRAQGSRPIDGGGGRSRTRWVVFSGWTLWLEGWRRASVQFLEFAVGARCQAGCSALRGSFAPAPCLALATTRGGQDKTAMATHSPRAPHHPFHVILNIRWGPASRNQLSFESRRCRGRRFSGGPVGRGRLDGADESDEPSFVGGHGRGGRRVSFLGDPMDGALAMSVCRWASNAPWSADVDVMDGVRPGEEQV